MKILSSAILAAILMLPSDAILAQNAGITFGDAAHDVSQPIEIVSDSLSLDQSSGVAVFSGNVLVVQDALRLSADQIEVNYVVENGNATGDIDTMTASGNVLLVNGDETAKGAKAVYAVRDDIIVMTGDVLLSQGSSALSGEKLVVNLGDSTGVMEGRVRTILQPAADK